MHTAGSFNDYRDQGAAALVLGYLNPSPPYVPEALALFERMSVQPDTERKMLINTTISGLIDAGLWDELETLYVTAAHDAQAARLNWKSGNFTLTPVNAPTFTPDRGYAGDGSTSYLNTGFSIADGSLTLQNSTSLGCYINAGATTGVLSSKAMGSQNPGVSLVFITPRDDADHIRAAVNAGSATSFGSATVTTRAGFSIVSRTGSTTTEGYRDGTSVGTASTSSAGRPDEPIFIGGWNQGSGVLAQAINNRFAAAFIGAGLTTEQVEDLTTIINEYLTAIGAE